MRKGSLGQLGDVYGSMLNDIKKTIKESTGPGGKSLIDYKPEVQDGGPSEKGGFHKSVHDEIMDMYDKNIAKDKKKKVKPTCDEDEEDETSEETSEETSPKKKEKPAWVKQKEDWNAQAEEAEEEDDNDNEEDEEIVENVKNSNQRLNRIMSRKNQFDQLYRKVLKENFGTDENFDGSEDLDALGIGDATADSDLDEGGFGDEEGDEDTVTITISRKLAEELHNVFAEVLGDNPEGEGDDDFGGEDDLDFGGEDDVFGEEDEEDEESAPAPKKATKKGPAGSGSSLQGKNNKVPGKVKVKSQSASSDVTDKIGDDGDYGHAITSGRKPNMGTGNTNKVGNLKTSQEFFG